MTALSPRTAFSQREERREALGVVFKGISKSYGETEVLYDFNLTVEPGELVTLLGPSGSGKTTVLNLLAGFTDVSKGEVFIGDREVTELSPEARNLGMVFQSFALFPHLSVLDNVSFPLKMRRVQRAERRRLAMEVLARVELEAFAGRRPHELSGGQKQRVAIARALVFRPPVLLMDECLSSLDLKLREQLQVEIKRLHRQIGSTILFVTHDQGEAMTLSDRIAVMRDGRLIQIGSPREIYERPANRFIASFIGKSNLFEVLAGKIDGTECCSLDLPDDKKLISVRPNAIRILERRDDAEVAFHSVVIDVAFQGTTIEYLLQMTNGKEVTVQCNVADDDMLALGQRALFGFSADQAIPLDEN